MALEARQAAIRALDRVLRERRMLAHLPPDPRLPAAEPCLGAAALELLENVFHRGPLFCRGHR
jgi:hypothetical protein